MFSPYKKESTLVHSRAKSGRLRHVSSSREDASRKAFFVSQNEASYDIERTLRGI